MSSDSFSGQLSHPLSVFVSPVKPVPGCLNHSSGSLRRSPTHLLSPCATSAFPTEDWSLNYQAEPSFHGKSVRGGSSLERAVYLGGKSVHSGEESFILKSLLPALPALSVCYICFSLPVCPPPKKLCSITLGGKPLSPSRLTLLPSSRCIFAVGPDL